MQPYIATFSIVAYDPANGDLGVAVASKFLAVGAVVPWAQALVGAVATQAHANVAFGPQGLALLASGASAAEALEALLANDPQREQRQVGIVDANGQAAAHTGNACHAWAGHHVGAGYAVQGNILAGQGVVDAIATAFEQSSGELAERLYAGLLAGDAAGGDRRGRQSAALYVARTGGSYGGTMDRYIDLRVDDLQRPVEELGRLLRLHRFYLTPPRQADLIPINPQLAAELQTMLQKAGFYHGPIDGNYSPETQKALETYGGIENLEERLISSTAIDPEVLAFLRERLT